MFCTGSPILADSQAMCWSTFLCHFTLGKFPLIFGWLLPQVTSFLDSQIVAYSQRDCCRPQVKTSRRLALISICYSTTHLWYVTIPHLRQFFDPNWWVSFLGVCLKIWYPLNPLVTSSLSISAIGGSPFSDKLLLGLWLFYQCFFCWLPAPYRPSLVFGGGDHFLSKWRPAVSLFRGCFELPFGAKLKSSWVCRYVHTDAIGYIILVGGFKHFFFSIIYGIIPTPLTTAIFFKMVVAPPTRWPCVDIMGMSKKNHLKPANQGSRRLEDVASTGGPGCLWSCLFSNLVIALAVIWKRSHLQVTKCFLYLWKHGTKKTKTY